MYEDFFGLSDKPFSLLPDAGTLYPSKRHRRALNMLDYGVQMEAGFVVITGEVGAGKTTVVRHFLKRVGSNITLGIITNPSASAGRLFDWVALAFDLKERSGDETTLYDAFVHFLIDQYGKGKRTILIVDEAQNLTVSMLEDLRMLSNINNEKDLLLQIILVGQPELLETLKRPDLRQFVQRITVHCHLDPLTVPETAAYIRYRLEQVGGRPGLFDDLACAAVYYFTGGVPRLINLLCDQSLVYAFSDERPSVSFELVAEVAADSSSSGLSAFLNISEKLSPERLKEKLLSVAAKLYPDKKDFAGIS